MGLANHQLLRVDNFNSDEVVQTVSKCMYVCMYFVTVPGIIAAVGVSNLQFVDMNSSRNICIFGFSLFLGIALPAWLQEGNTAKINTGRLFFDCICMNAFFPVQSIYYLYNGAGRSGGSPPVGSRGIKAPVGGLENAYVNISSRRKAKMHKIRYERFNRNSLCSNAIARLLM